MKRKNRREFSQEDKVRLVAAVIERVSTKSSPTLAHACAQEGITYWNFKDWADILGATIPKTNRGRPSTLRRQLASRVAVARSPLFTLEEQAGIGLWDTLADYVTSERGKVVTLDKLKKISKLLGAIAFTAEIEAYEELTEESEDTESESGDSDLVAANGAYSAY